MFNEVLLTTEQDSVKLHEEGSGEMAQWLRTAIALSEDLGSIPSTYM